MQTVVTVHHPLQNHAITNTNDGCHSMKSFGETLDTENKEELTGSSDIAFQPHGIGSLTRRQKIGAASSIDTATLGAAIHGQGGDTFSALKCGQYKAESEENMHLYI